MTTKETKPERTFARIVFDRLEALWAESDKRKAAAKRQEAANNAK